MAETENITILRVGTEEAVRNIQDLKDNIVQLKKDLQGLDIGSEEYSKTLKELNVNQNALRDAMHYTNTEGQTSEQVMNGIANAASGAGNSYNALVAQMKSLREQWRATDDVARRNELGKQINDVNDKLKALDASTGSFKRNVGDYEGALRRTADAFRATAGSASAAIGPAKGLKSAFDAFDGHPIIAMLGVAAALIYKVADGLKSSETNFWRLQNAMSVFQGIGNQTTILIQKMASNLAGWIELVGLGIEKLLEFSGADTTFIQKQRAVNQLERQIVEDRRRFTTEDGELLARISALRYQAVDTEHYTAEERKKALDEAIALQNQVNQHNLLIALNEERLAKMRSDLADNSVEENNALAAATRHRMDVEKQNAESLRSLTREMNRTQRELNSVKPEPDDDDDATEAMRNRIKERLKAIVEARRAAEEEAKQEAAINKTINKWNLEDTENITSQLDALWDQHFEHVVEANEEANKKMAESRKQALAAAVSATSSILGSVADIYESVNAEDEKAAQQTKALRIAGAIIDTISGAVAAFTSAQSIPPPAGQIIGAANAAAVTAEGIAQIAKIRSTNVSRTSTANTSLSGFSTPTVSTSVPQTTIVRGAQDQTLLNQLAQPSRVYILQSDIEAAAKASKARVADTTFE